MPRTTDSNGTQIICLPPNDITRLRSYMPNPDFLTRPLTPDSYERTTLVLAGTLTEATASAVDKYRCEDNFLLLINKIRPTVKGVSPGTTEALTYSGTAVVDPEKVRAMRMLNCAVTLENQTRNEFLVGTPGDNSAQMCLYDISDAGGGEIDFGETPAIIGPGDSLKLSVELIDGDNALEAAAGASYGLILTITKLRLKKG